MCIRDSNKAMSRILDNDIMGDEEFVERTLRPQYLKEYIGQDKVCLLYTSLITGFLYVSEQICYNISR